MIDYSTPIKHTLRNDWLRSLLVFSVTATLLTIIYLPNHKTVSLDDPFFHIRFAEIIRENGLEAFRDFKWIYFSKMAVEPQGYFVYYNFLFYLALIPFTFFNPLFLGIKLYGIFFGSLSLTVLYWFLRRLEIKYPEIWLVFLLSAFANGFLQRFILARPFAFAPILLIILLFFLYRRNYIGVFILSALYLYWHTATFFFPLAIVFLYFLSEIFWRRRADWWKLLAGGGGVALSFFSSFFFAPGLPRYLYEMVWGVISYTALQNRTVIPEGNELYAADPLNYLHANLLIFAVLIILVVLETFRHWPQHSPAETMATQTAEQNVLQSTLFLLVIGFFLGLSLSYRNQDFFVFFVATYLPLAASRLLSNLQINPPVAKKAATIGILILLAFLSSSNLLTLQENLAAKADHQTIEQAANWLNRNVPENTVVFNASWSDFVRLFYYSPSHYYIVGLEPKFLYNYDRGLYWLWHHLVYKGSVCNKERCDYRTPLLMDLGNGPKPVLANEIVRNIFMAEYIVSPKEYSRWLNSLLANKEGFQLVYDDRWYQIHKAVAPTADAT